MVWVPEELRRAQERVTVNQHDFVVVRRFLSWFGYERRGKHVVAMVRRALDELSLYTSPDFEYEWIDGIITILPKLTSEEKSQQEIRVTMPSAGHSGTEYAAPILTQSPAVVGGATEDPTYRIGKLEAANKPPKSVKPDSTLQEAITIMLKEDFSQLPVMTSDRDVKGVVSWQTIASRLALGRDCKLVRDCAETFVEIVEADTSLFRLIETIAEHGFVLVRDKERKISGIVTEADLGRSFYQLGRPFLLLSEIENHIRGIIDGKFTIDELNEVRTPGDTDRDISNVSDLTFGGYVRLLQNPAKWDKVGLKIDRNTFVKTLERVNSIRNDVMHFDPDGLGHDDLEELRKTATFVRELREILGQ